MGLMRLLLAIWVVLVHSSPLFGVVGVDAARGTVIGMNGDLAVTCFFIVSGFLVTMILDEKYQDTGRFYRARLLRLMPLYYLALVLAVMLCAAGLYAGDYARSVADLVEDRNIAGLLYVAFINVFLLGIEANDITGANGLLPQAWTLSVELQFYLLAPLLCRLPSHALGLLALFLYFLQTSAVDFARTTFGLQIDHLFIANAHFFVFGALAYRLMRHHRIDEWRSGRRRAVVVGVSLFILAYSVAAYALHVNRIVQMQVFYVVFAASLPFLFSWTRTNRWDRWLGELSYPIYLVHFALVPVAVRLVGEAQTGLVVLALSLVLSTAYMVTLHGPLEDFRRRTTGPARPPSARRPALVPYASAVDAPVQRFLTRRPLRPNVWRL